MPAPRTAVERRDCLQAQIDGPGPLPQAIDALLQPPLYQTAFVRGYGTLYSAVYRPRSGSIELLWPGQRWAQTLDAFNAGQRDVAYLRGTATSTAVPRES